MPVALRHAARDPYNARALIYATLLSDDKAIRHKQCELIVTQAEPGVDGKLISLYTILKAVGREIYIPLVELALPTLRSCSRQQIARFRRIMNLLIHIDQHVSLFEWCLRTLINNNLDVVDGRELNSPVRRRRLHQLQIQVRVIMSLLVQVGEADEATSKKVFERSLSFLDMESGDMYSSTNLRFNTVDNALKQLDRMPPKDKQRFMEACTMTLHSNYHNRFTGFEVVHAIAAALHCPITMASHHDAVVEPTTTVVQSPAA